MVIKMKKASFIFLFSILLLGLVGAGEICIDLNAPSAPTNLILTSSGLNVQLRWSGAIDEPDCSGVSHYNIYRDDNLIANSITSLTYSDNNLVAGTYNYKVSAVDLADHEGEAAMASITISMASTSSSGGSGGGGGVTTYITQTNNGGTDAEPKLLSTTNLGETEKQENIGAGITGGVVGFMKSGLGFGLIIGILIILAGIGVVMYKNKSSKNGKK